MNPWWSIKRLLTSVSLWTRRSSEQLRLCPLGVISESALNASPRGVIHSGRATDCLSAAAHSSDRLSSNVKQRCHFHFNMQRSLKGMLIWAFIKRTALSDSPRVSAEFFLAAQVTHKSALAMEGQVISHPSSQIVVGWVDTLLIVG